MQLRICLSLILFIFAFLSFDVNAAVRDFSKSFSVALVGEANNFVLGLRPTVSGSQSKVSYQPNTTSISGIEITTHGFTLAYKTAAVMSPGDQVARGKTSYEDIRGALILGQKKQWLLIGYYNRYGGMFINNTSDFDPSFATSGIYIQRSDFSIFNSGLAVMYIFNPDKFSLAASVFQSAQQTESAGSFLAMLSGDGTLFTATDPIIPSQAQNQFGQDALLTSGKFTTASAAIGYGYTFTGNSFFLTLVALFGPGYQWREYSVANIVKTSSINTSKVVYGASLGYNGERFFSGVSLINNSTSYHTESISFEVSLSSIRVFAGLRF